MRLRISHSTTYEYDPPATGVIQVLRMTPGNHDGQYVANWQVDVSGDARLDMPPGALRNLTHALRHRPPPAPATCPERSTPRTAAAFAVARSNDSRQACSCAPRR